MNAGPHPGVRYFVGNVVEALEARADELTRLRAEHIGLLVQPR